MIDFTSGPVVTDLSVRWIHGRPRKGGAGDRRDDPPIQVHWADPHTAILRQSKQLTFEAPFLFLLFGNDAVLLLDTGAIEDAEVMPLRRTVDELIARWLVDNPRDGSAADYRLIVAHTHGHGDHVDGDSQFAERSNTTVVGKDIASVIRFFSFRSWPRETVPLDLGGRVLEVTAAPGHHDAAIAIYDPWTGFLLTGDTVYPGRLYVNNIEAFVTTLDDLVTITTQRRVSAVIGCHIEMTTKPGVDYPVGTRYQPDEPPLPMSVDQLKSVRDAAHRVKDQPGVHVFDDFAIFNGRCVGGMLRQLARANGNRVRDLVMQR